MLWSAFILGLISSAHCVGMCGPLALLLGSTQSGINEIYGRLLYNLGRAASYTILGITLGSLTGLFDFVNYQPLLSILSGGLIILFSISQIIFNRRAKMSIPFLDKLKLELGKRIKFKSLFSQFTFGMLNGIIPCGLVYFALVGAISTGNWASSGTFMFVYGLGTIPLMFVFSFGTKLLGQKLSSFINKRIPYFIFFIGLLFILKGLQLGIPFISPNHQLETPDSLGKGNTCINSNN